MGDLKFHRQCFLPSPFRSSHTRWSTQNVTSKIKKSCHGDDHDGHDDDHCGDDDHSGDYDHDSEDDVCA